MLSFLFWNLHGSDAADNSQKIRTRLTRIAAHFDVDIFIFAESGTPPESLASVLSAAKKGDYWHSRSECIRLQILVRLEPSRILPQYDAPDDRLTIRCVKMGDHDINIAAVHLRSQLHQSEAAAGYQATIVQNDIATVERSLNNYYTVVVGDMNMNPFSNGMVAVQAFHGVMTKEIADSKERIVEGRSYRCFYNPMWGYFGDRIPGPAGTYFYSSSSSIEYHWHIFDQVLIRPELMNALYDLQILDTDGEQSLINKNGRPDQATASDHLPILFRLRTSASEYER